MTKPKQAPRSTGAPGAKSLITALAVAATLAGWAQLTAQETPAAASDLTETTAAASLPAWLLEPVPIPAMPTVGAGVAPQIAIAPARSTLNSLPAPVTSTRSSR
jgi:hypothetical protein